MSKPKIVGISLFKQLILIHYVEEDDKLIDERIVAVKWKANPALQRLVKAFAEIASNYILGGNNSLDKLEGEDLTQLYKDLLDDEKNP